MTQRKDEFTAAEGRRAIALAIAAHYHQRQVQGSDRDVVETAKLFHTYIVNGNPPKD